MMRFTHQWFLLLEQETRRLAYENGAALRFHRPERLRSLSRGMADMVVVIPEHLFMGLCNQLLSDDKILTKDHASHVTIACLSNIMCI